MKKQLILVAFFGFIIFGFGSVNSALAIINQPIDITSLGDEVGLAGEPIDGVDVSLGKNLGGLMASSDLGIDNVGTLPTSPFYFFKEWGRGIQRFFTIDSVAKAELELNITNQTAAELLEVEKTYEACAANALGGGKSCKPEDKVGSVKTALQNFIKAQERLNFKMTTINGTSNVTDLAKLLEDVDGKTAKHVALLEQVSARVTFTRTGTCGAFCQQYEDLQSVVDNALDNTLKTFTVTVTPVNDAPSLKQKAEEQIKRAGIAINEANSTMQEVSTARGINVNPGGVDVRDSIKIVETIDEQSSIFDRWGNLITKAKGNLDNAKKAFAEGKYGEAYGQARSAEAMVTVLATGQNFPDARINTTTPTPSPALKLSPKPSVTPTARPTPEKTETPASAGSPVR